MTLPTQFACPLQGLRRRINIVLNSFQSVCSGKSKQIFFLQFGLKKRKKNSNMLNIATGSILILVNVALVLGRTFTFRIASGTTECFYGMTIKPNEKLGFYFNVI